MFHTRSNGATVVVALALLFVTGCTNSEPQNIAPPPTPAYDPYPVSAYPQIAFIPGLERRLVLSGAPAVTKASTDDPMTVRAELRSIAPDSTTVEYCFTFYDRTGREVSERRWDIETFPPGHLRQISRTSISAEAVKWRLEVRELPKARGGLIPELPKY